MTVINLDSDDPTLRPYIDVITRVTAERDRYKREAARLHASLHNATIERESLLLRIRDAARAAVATPDRSLRDALINGEDPL